MADDAAKAGSDGAPRRRRRPEPTPAQRALALLVRREHSGKELKRKLVARGVDRDAAEQAVARMREAGWQDDHRFAAGLARMRATGGYGPIRIRAELETHGLSADAVQAGFDALAEEGDDRWLRQAVDLVIRRFGEGVADDPALQRKAAELLYRRGFDGDCIRRAARLEDDDFA